MNFLKNILASCLGTFLAMVLVVLILVVMVMSSIGGGGNKPVAVTDNSVLHITLDKPVVERGNDSDFNFDPTTFQPEFKMGLNHFVKDVDRAKSDDHIKGIFLEIKQINAAPSAMFDLRRAIKEFQDSGKWVVAYSEDFTQGGYYVASVADEIYLYPEGSFDWRGLNAEIMFFKKMLDKLEIEAQVIRPKNNKFKSAVEPFLYDQMSEANEKQIAEFIGDIWRVMVDGIAEERNIAAEQLLSFADSLSFALPQKAVDAHLLDGLKYRDEVMALLNDKLGNEGALVTSPADSTATKKEPNLISLENYHTTRATKKDDNEKSDFSKDKVAVIYAVGDIESGEGDDMTIGSERIAKALQKAREDKKVKAIVLRVNSPGGSALASDVIWRETKLIRQSGKPFVVSMGDYAASGGYYISTAAEKIFANSITITGSIGVFGIIPNMQKFWDNKLGITFDRYQTNPHAGWMTANKPLDPKELEYVQTMVDDIYGNFTSIVAEGRHKTQAEIDSIGQGRVWSGEDGKRIGLVDEIGNLNDAIKAAAAMANMTDYAVKEMPDLIDPIQELINEISGNKKTAMLRQALGEHYEKFEQVNKLSTLKGIQTRIPYSLEIK